MLGTGEIIGIVSIVITMLLGSHIAFHSNCFGLRVDSDGTKLDINIGNEQVELTPSDIKLQAVDASGNPIQTIIDIPISLPKTT